VRGAAGRSVGECSVGECSVGERSVGERSVGELSVGERSVTGLTVRACVRAWWPWSVLVFIVFCYGATVFGGRAGGVRLACKCAG
jgi:hypothetical protein